GPGARADDGERRSVDLSEGDKVLFGKFAGTEVTYEGTEYLIMREDDILAII
ncbi:co-chaperone GroES, partial [Candidatus Poribacteria bacterium]|nr:co-chaperone GroES [Candidatus Poribacteria bacterium]